jgi:hypothetical protein
MINIERGGNKEEESENKDNTFDITKVVLGDVKCVVLVFALFLFISPSFDIDHLFFFNDVYEGFYSCAATVE